MLTVHLHNLIFYGYHGLYAGEEKAGNDFEVSLDVNYEASEDRYNNLKYLVSYEEVYRIVKERMHVPAPLLEELADAIIRQIRERYQQVTSVRITIYKLNAPIESFHGKAGITLFKQFS
ncbi:dihydroneopterin aldolase [Flavihumibacter solisilvae]|uniref:dihydroneopterin aldolase n=1 Tax=Flavihumibacter solisilvae TaxID=1349421 RepID=A0A0C1LHS9_9BACT|nr:dihydroneopterin aldolase [Flavihumibacter solisilvae]KIC94938.1 hypothetical protein OI18_08535 [Flavihumibacter solisilvae]